VRACFTLSIAPIAEIELTRTMLSMVESLRTNELRAIDNRKAATGNTSITVSIITRMSANYARLFGEDLIRAENRMLIQHPRTQLCTLGRACRARSRSSLATFSIRAAATISGGDNYAFFSSRLSTHVGIKTSRQTRSALLEGERTEDDARDRD